MHVFFYIGMIRMTDIIGMISMIRKIVAYTTYFVMKIWRNKITSILGNETKLKTPRDKFIFVFCNISRKYRDIHCNLNEMLKEVLPVTC